MAEQSKTWEQRKKLYKSIQVKRDEAEWVKTLADAADESIADYVSSLIRPTILAKVRLLAEKTLRETDAAPAARERKQRRA